MNKFSALKYLQKKVAEQCALLHQSFNNISHWEEYKSSFLDRLVELLPVIEPMNPQPDYSIMECDLSDNLVLEYVAVNFDSGFFIPVNIYKPRMFEGKLPVVLVCPGYGQPKNAEDIISVCMDLAQDGIIAVTLDYAGVGEAADRPDINTNVNNIDAAASLLGINDIGLRVMSNLAVLRHLKTLDYVDSGRIGITGICQGSIVLWYTAALSDDFRAIAPVCGTTTYEAEVLEYSGRQGGWTGISPFVFKLLKYGDVQHLYGCFAPRPLFVQSNIIDRHWPSSGFQKIQEFTKNIYSLYGVSDNCRFLIEDEPHAFSEAFIDNLTKWFLSQLS